MYANELDNTLVGTELADIGRLRQVAQRLFPEEVCAPIREVLPDDVTNPQMLGGASSAVAQAGLPFGTSDAVPTAVNAVPQDEPLNLAGLEAGFLDLLHGGTGFPAVTPLDQPAPPVAPASAAVPDETAVGGVVAPTLPAGFDTLDSAANPNGFGVGIPETQSLRELRYEDGDTLDEKQIRNDFPILKQQVNGHPLVWLDNGATTQKPKVVIDALSDYYTNYNSNIHRGAHTLAAHATDAYEEARSKVARFINAPSGDNIVFVRGTTEGINLVAQTFGRKYLNPGDEVIVSTLDHHANIVPWQQVCKERGARLVAIPIDERGDLLLDEYERLIGPRTRFVSVGHVNNTYGTINDIRRIIDVAHRHQVPVLIDGAQSVAHTRIDVQELGCDYFVFSGHKIYGPNGIGAVYGTKQALELLPPWQGGGNMIKDVTIDHTEFNGPPARFEAGTPNVADAIGLGYALDYVARIGIPNIERHEHDLTEYARQQISLIPGITIIGDPRHRVSVVSLDVEGIPAPEVGQMLDKEGIAVRAGHHCAQPALRALGYEMSVRPTFALYNTRQDVDRLVVALRKIVSRKR